MCDARARLRGGGSVRVLEAGRLIDGLLAAPSAHGHVLLLGEAIGALGAHLLEPPRELLVDALPLGKEQNERYRQQYDADVDREVEPPLRQCGEAALGAKCALLDGGTQVLEPVLDGQGRCTDVHAQEEHATEQRAEREVLAVEADHCSKSGDDDEPDDDATVEIRHDCPPEV